MAHSSSSDEEHDKRHKHRRRKDSDKRGSKDDGDRHHRRHSGNHHRRKSEDEDHDHKKGGRHHSTGGHHHKGGKKHKHKGVDEVPIPEEEEDDKAEAPALMLNVTDAPHVEGSEYSFEHLHQNRVSTLDMELKRVLTDDSAARLQEIESKKTINRKLDLLELARNEAEVVAAIRTIEDNEDPEDELNCCWRKRAKEVRQFKKFAEDSEDEGYRITKDEVLMSKAQRIAKWIVILVAISDFILATEDTYLILLRKMQTEYLFLAQIYNCQRLLSSGDDVLIWANVIHCVFCVGLLFMEDKSTCNFGIYWIVSQSIRTFLMLAEAFFRSRFKQHCLRAFFSFLYWRLPLDLLQIGAVMFRYYKLNNPFPKRLKTLAAEIHLDRPLNSELRLRDSTFLQSKYRLREAAAFQTLEIIRKVEKRAKEVRTKSRMELIRIEIEKAFHVLTNPKRYPKKQTMAQARTKKTKIDDEDDVTIFQPESAASVFASNPTFPEKEEV